MGNSFINGMFILQAGLQSLHGESFVRTKAIQA